MGQETKSDKATSLLTAVKNVLKKYWWAFLVPLVVKLTSHWIEMSWDKPARNNPVSNNGPVEISPTTGPDSTDSVQSRVGPGTMRSEVTLGFPNSSNEKSPGRTTEQWTREDRTSQTGLHTLQNIYGRVVDEHGTALEEVSITLVGTGQQTKTNSSGAFELRTDIPLDEFRLSYSKDGYKAGDEVYWNSSTGILKALEHK